MSEARQNERSTTEKLRLTVPVIEVDETSPLANRPEINITDEEGTASPPKDQDEKAALNI